MLILGRRRNESIIISEDIVVTVLETQKRRVKLGIQAPAHIHVLRTELRATTERPLDRQSVPLVVTS